MNPARVAKETLDTTLAKVDEKSDPWLADALKSAKDGKALYADYKARFPGAIE